MSNAVDQNDIPCSAPIVAEKKKKRKKKSKSKKKFHSVEKQKEFFTWLEKIGAKGTKDVELAYYDGMGYGIRAKKAFKKGDYVLKIPIMQTICVKNARKVAKLDAIFTKHNTRVVDTIVLYLLWHCQLGDKSNLAPWIRLLPSRYPCSGFYIDSQNKLIKGTPLAAKIESFIVQAKEDYKELIPIFQANKEIFQPEFYTFQKYIWAMSTLYSRGLDFSVKVNLRDDKKFSDMARFIVPGADFFNHDPSLEPCHRIFPLPKTNPSIAVIAGKDCVPGEQILISYGPASNMNLIVMAGFAVQNNPHENVEFPLKSPEKLAKKMVRAGIQPNVRIMVKHDGSGMKTVVGYARLLTYLEHHGKPPANFKKGYLPMTPLEDEKVENEVMEKVTSLIADQLKCFEHNLSKKDLLLMEKSVEEVQDQSQLSRWNMCIYHEACKKVLSNLLAFWEHSRRTGFQD